MKKVLKTIAIFAGGMFAGYLLSNRLYSLADRMHDDEFLDEANNYDGNWVDEYFSETDNEEESDTEDEEDKENE